MQNVNKKFHFFLESKNWIFLEQKLDDSAKTLIGPRKYIASFRHKNKHLCSAFFISNKHALTAANCLHDFSIYKDIPDFSEYFIVAGFSELGTEKVIHKIYEVRVHRCYNPMRYTTIYDIGLIKVEYKFLIDHAIYMRVN